MWTDSPEKADLAPLFAAAEAGSIAPIGADQLASITSSGRRRRRHAPAGLGGPVALASAGIVAGGIVLTGSSSHHTSRVTIIPAASTKPARAKATAAATTPCNAASAHHYLVAAEIPAGLGDRKDSVPTAAVPIDIAWPGATAADSGFDFKVACTSAAPAVGRSVDINGVTGTISHPNSASTIAWSPAPGFQVSYSSFGGNGPVSDSVLIAMARAVPTAP
jgi:hypothetical protein